MSVQERQLAIAQALFVRWVRRSNARRTAFQGPFSYTEGEQVQNLPHSYRQGFLDDAAAVMAVEDARTAAAIEAEVGGAYRMQDGRTFWIDASVAREIARRAVSGSAGASS